MRLKKMYPLTFAEGLILFWWMERLCWVTWSRRIGIQIILLRCAEK